MRKALRRHKTERTVVVADRGMLSRGSLEALAAMGCGCVMGAKLRGLTREMKERALDASAYRPLGGEGGRRFAELECKGQRMAVRWCPKRAEKDAHDCRWEAERLERQLTKSDSLG